MVWLGVMIGGGLGAVARHALNTAIQRHTSSSFPIGIVVVNAVGCLAAGLLAGLLASGRLQVGQASRTFIFAGVLGGFTTFSSYALDSYTMLRAGSTAPAFLNLAGQVIVGFAALAAGFAIGAWRQ